MALGECICVWFILGEGGEILRFVGDILRLDVGFEGVQLEFGFIWTACDGTF